MMCGKWNIAYGCLLMLLITGCSRKPDYVIGSDEMVALMTDIHKGESVVDLQRNQYNDDSLKKVLKQSIYLKHGVTQAQVDTSFVWYGNHIEDYIKIYDKVIENLQGELDALDSKGGGNLHIYAVGDSIDVWPGSSSYRLTDRLAVNSLVFDFDKDDNWQNGDNYTLQFKVINSRTTNPDIDAALFADYETGKTEYRILSAGNEGWMKVRLITDSTENANRLYGWIGFRLAKGETIYLDSVAMIRTRNIPTTYSGRAGQKTIFPIGNKDTNQADDNLNIVGNEDAKFQITEEVVSKEKLQPVKLIDSDK